MIKSMFSGVTGLRNHQTRLDVIGNNIANVNTTGFKGSRVVFTDVYYQTLNAASGPGLTEGSRGGVNPSQVGYGSQMATVDMLNTPGGYMQTDRATDLYISGEGYFVIGNTQGDSRYTRVGNFTFDAYGYLVDFQGNHVQGASYEYDIDTDTGELTRQDESDAGLLATDGIYGEPILLENLRSIQIDRHNYSNISIGADGKITGISNDTGEIETLGQIALANFANPDALSQEGNMQLRPTPNSGPAVFNAPNTLAAGSFKSNGLEMSNVDLSQQFTDMIIAQRGLQANSRLITTSDEVLQELVNLKR